MFHVFFIDLDNLLTSAIMVRNKREQQEQKLDFLLDCDIKGFSKNVEPFLLFVFVFVFALFLFLLLLFCFCFFVKDTLVVRKKSITATVAYRA